MRIMRKNHENRQRPKNGAKPIHIEFTHTTAIAVSIAGTFNNWRPEPAKRDANGTWSTELMLPPGNYEYLIVADGTWLPDPHATGAVPNPFGGVNSLLTVTE